MNSIGRTLSMGVVAMAIVGLGACSGMSRQDKATIGGAAIGGVAGSVLSGGSAVGTVGGAAVGGVVGHEVEKKK